MAVVLLSLEECSVCLALVKPESKADHEAQHSTNTNISMAEQRRRNLARDARLGPGPGTRS
jgi:hypothetical protein